MQIGILIDEIAVTQPQLAAVLSFIIDRLDSLKEKQAQLEADLATLWEERECQLERNILKNFLRSDLTIEGIPERKKSLY